MCDKVQFSKTQAEKVIKSRRLSRITKKKSRVYFCKECYFYHITTTNGEGKRIRSKDRLIYED